MAGILQRADWASRPYADTSEIRESAADVPCLLAAVEAVLKLADDGGTGVPPVRIREAITRELTGKEAGDRG
jgi:hypothetical protein